MSKLAEILNSITNRFSKKDKEYSEVADLVSKHQRNRNPYDYSDNKNSELFDKDKGGERHR